MVSLAHGGKLLSALLLGVVLNPGALSSTAPASSSTAGSDVLDLDESIATDDEVCFLQARQQMTTRVVDGYSVQEGVQTPDELKRWADHLRFRFSQQQLGSESPAQARGITSLRHFANPMPQSQEMVLGSISHALRRDARSQSNTTAQLGIKPSAPSTEKEGMQRFKQKFSELLRVNAKLRRTLASARTAAENSSTLSNSTNSSTYNPSLYLGHFEPPEWVQPVGFVILILLSAISCCCCCGALGFHQYKASEAKKKGVKINDLGEEATLVNSSCISMLGNCNFCVTSALNFACVLFLLAMAYFWRIGVLQYWLNLTALCGILFSLTVCCFCAFFYTWSEDKKIGFEKAEEQIKELSIGVQYLASVQAANAAVEAVNAAKGKGEKPQQSGCFSSRGAPKAEPEPPLPPPPGQYPPPPEQYPPQPRPAEQFPPPRQQYPPPSTGTVPAKPPAQSSPPGSPRMPPPPEVTPQYPQQPPQAPPNLYRYSAIPYNQPQAQPAGINVSVPIAGQNVQIGVPPPWAPK